MGDWRARAACRDTDPEAFFPGYNGAEPSRYGSAAGAKRVCAGCPVAVPCLDYALAHLEHGVWGGTTEAERAAMLGLSGKRIWRHTAAAWG